MWYLVGAVIVFLAYKALAWLFQPDEQPLDDESVGVYHFYHKDD